MRAIYKQILHPGGWQEVPNFPLFFHEQHGELVVWYEHDDVDPGLKHLVRVYGTGHQVQHGAEYVSSCVMSGGALIWHLFTIDRSLL